MHLVTLWGLVTLCYTLFLLNPYKSTMVVNLELSVTKRNCNQSVTRKPTQPARSRPLCQVANRLHRGSEVAKYAEALTSTLTGALLESLQGFYPRVGGAVSLPQRALSKAKWADLRARIAEKLRFFFQIRFARIPQKRANSSLHR